MDPITIHPLLAGAIGTAVVSAFGWLTKYFIGELSERKKTIEGYKEKVAAAYAEGKETEKELEGRIVDKDKRIRDLERRLSWFEAKYGDDDSEPPEVARTTLDGPRS